MNKKRYLNFNKFEWKRRFGTCNFFIPKIHLKSRLTRNEFPRVVKKISFVDIDLSIFWLNSFSNNLYAMIQKISLSDQLEAVLFEWIYQNLILFKSIDLKININGFIKKLKDGDENAFHELKGAFCYIRWFICKSIYMSLRRCRSFILALKPDSNEI